MRLKKRNELINQEKKQVSFKYLKIIYILKVFKESLSCFFKIYKKLN